MDPGIIDCRYAQSRLAALGGGHMPFKQSGFIESALGSPSLAEQPAVVACGNRANPGKFVAVKP